MHHKHSILKAKNKQLAVLVDPDQEKLGKLDELLEAIALYKIPIVLLGGSFITNDQVSFCIRRIRQRCPEATLALFPGSTYQLHPDVDLVLFLSLLSGRNPDYLIGRQVIAAPYIKKYALETIGTGYLLIDGGKTTAAHYISQSMPIPRDQPAIASSTALAGELMGMELIYMDAGSGAQEPISTDMVHRVKQDISIPLAVGGGIKTAEACYDLAIAGADIVVVGNTFEENPSTIADFQLSLREASESIHN